MPTDATTGMATRLERHGPDRVVRCFTQRPAHVNQMWREAARWRPEAEALVCGERRLSWAMLEDQVLRTAAGLQALGVAPGDRVALLLGNSVEFVIASFAVQAAGAVLVPLNIRDQTPGLAYCLQHCGASVLISDAALQDRWPAPSETPALKHRVRVGVPPEHAGSFERLLQHTPLADCVAVDEDGVAVILYTSGTTGFPKGAMLTHLNIVHSVLHYAQALSLPRGVRGAAVVPLSHVTGLVGLMMVTLGLGGTLLVQPAFKAADFLRFAARERMGFTVMVPAMYKLCLLQDDFAAHDLSAWQVGGFGGAPMPPATIDQLAQQLPALRLSNCYGATETASPATIMPAHLTRAHLDSVGLALPCAEVAVMDEQGVELPRGGVGELWLKGPMVVQGYWNNPQATADNFIGGFWRSGDVGSMDTAGFVRVLDRHKDMLNRGGYKIFSVEVENVLCQHPDVLEAAVVAKRCPVLGERVHVFVAAREGRTLDAEDLRTFCAARLSDYKVPESYSLGREPLPRNANGKLMKRVLRERLLSETGQAA
ncbi:MAG: class I adenylate-forming enzyme family protein [Hydrogenophaga sp.]|uniref:class I adenylate-forming enzyme family protein n=1 Tax=Hydrogenophaga sp. TaxID=1904254 RepID=UPI002736A51D|nr:class I adenylate-forming enzyme family protein [Hydrogenophaga sp.]MDP3345302.1 class I adenylate-forming enzyme family protein [Hydrogenophaga sp.]MDP3807192.1 class I adenylate-forming enzyme family protein [Hydrogenophaga sp.]